MPLSSLVGGDLTPKPALMTPNNCACGCASDGNCVGFVFYGVADAFYSKYPGCWWARVTNPLAQHPCTITPSAAPDWTLHIRAALSTNLQACLVGAAHCSAGNAPGCRVAFYKPCLLCLLCAFKPTQK